MEKSKENVERLKLPTTYEQQVEILENRGVVVTDRQYCINELKKINYYRFIAYLLPFKISNDQYKNISFEKAMGIYFFDIRLRSIITEILEEIEISMRTKIAYTLGHKYGPIGYMDEKIYKYEESFIKLKGEIENAIDKRKDTLVAKHHFNKYGGNFPIWVVIEFFSFGLLSKLYKNLKDEDKNLICKETYVPTHIHLESWLHALAALRNNCAHYSRLYYIIFSIKPKKLRKNQNWLNHRLFTYIHIMKMLYPDKAKWNNYFLVTISALLEVYNEDIDMKHIGFPDNWMKILRNI